MTNTSFPKIQKNRSKVINIYVLFCFLMYILLFFYIPSAGYDIILLIETMRLSETFLCPQLKTFWAVNTYSMFPGSVRSYTLYVYSFTNIAESGLVLAQPACSRSSGDKAQLNQRLSDTTERRHCCIIT